MKRRLALLSLGGALVHGFPAAADGNVEPKKWTRRRVRFSLLLTNPTERKLKAQAIYCYLPASALGRQNLISASVSVPHAVIPDSYGHNLLVMEFSELQPHMRKNITVDIILNIGTLAYGSTTPSQEWLRDEPFIECDAREIRDIAVKLKRADQISTAKASFKWVVENIRDSGYLSEDRGALDAILSGHGDCTEFAYLIVALCRANGIPSRMVGGHVIVKDAVLAPYDYHNWAEVYVSGYWIIADAQKGFWDPPSNEYLAFRFHSDLISNRVGMKHRFHVDGDAQVALVE
ncbi:MAG: transglutaminase domain-containing protein [Rhodoferax sp.]|nr:transglutaminase domain-containing protein [Rhodoferax sp.]